MKAIYGLYSSPHDAQRAVDALRKAGLRDREITVVSSEPLEEYEFASHDKESWMTWIAGLGGLIGLITGYLLTALTQKVWAINTGGMPIVTNWTNLIVIFELTMLGAVFASVITLLITAKIPGKALVPYDPEISDGKILIGVANPRKDSIGSLERALQVGRNSELKTLT